MDRRERALPSKRDREAQEKLAVAFDLFESAVQIMRQNLRRRHPEASEEEIEERLEAWILERPGPDAPGEPISEERLARILG